MLPTSLDHFRDFGLYEGDQILEKDGRSGPIGGFLAQAQAERFDYTPVPIIASRAAAGGVIQAEAVDFFAEKLVMGLKKNGPVDGLFFWIHGAAQSEVQDDAEGYLLGVVRDVLGPDVPIVCPMDHHANITKLKMDCLTGLVGHRTQPHDPFDTGQWAAKMLFAILRGEIHPTMAWHKIPIITHQEQFLTSRGPMKQWFDMARRFEELPAVISVSLFPMQPWLDAYEGGWTSVVVTEDDPPLARRLSAELANQAWELREAFWKMEGVSPAVAVRQAEEAPRGMIVLSDTGDTIWGGAVGDSTWILEQMLEQRIQSTALVGIFDPEVVASAIQAGTGAQISVDVGGKVDTRYNRPLRITGTVAGIGGGWIDATVKGTHSFDMGRAVRLDVGNVRLVVTEKRGVSGNYPVVFRHFGIDPAQAKMVVVKTSSNWHHYQEWISQVIRVDTPGPTMSHMDRFEWKRIPRPTWPLDDLAEWHAEL